MCIRDRFVSSLKNDGLDLLKDRIAEEIFGIVSLGSYKINPSKLDTVAKFGKILNVKNESNYLVLELEMRDKLVDRLLNLKIMEKNINA